jgi:membrane protein
MFKVARTLLKNTFKKWWDMDPFREGAIIAYYSIFALPGLLVVIVSVAGYFFGAEAVNSQVYNQISDAMGKETATQVKEIMEKAAESKNSIWATIIGLISILVGATAVFTQLQKSMNSIWGVIPSPNKTGIWTLIRVRVFSFGLIVSIAFLLLVSLVVTSVLSALGSWVQQYWSDSLMVIFTVLHFMVSLGIITVLFALMFKVLPDVIIPWKQIWIGALVTAFLFVLGKYALGLYFGKADPASGYGAAGSAVLILLWTSYSSMIVFLGNMFTKVYADHFQEEIHPSPYAIKQK